MDNRLRTSEKVKFLLDSTVLYKNVLTEIHWPTTLLEEKVPYILYWLFWYRIRMRGFPCSFISCQKWVSTTGKRTSKVRKYKYVHFFDQSQTFVTFSIKYNFAIIYRHMLWNWSVFFVKLFFTLCGFITTTQMTRKHSQCNLYKGWKVLDAKENWFTCAW